MMPAGMRIFIVRAMGSSASCGKNMDSERRSCELEVNRNVSSVQSQMGCQCVVNASMVCIQNDVQEAAFGSTSNSCA